VNDRVALSRAAQGLPSRVTDSVALVRIARLLAPEQFGLPERPMPKPVEVLPRRGERRMPSLASVALWHRLGAVPHCVHCGWQSWKATWNERSTGLERAHIIDRAVDNGLDHEGNLAPLCKRCHATQPIFKPGQEAEALAWFNLAGAA